MARQPPRCRAPRCRERLHGPIEVVAVAGASARVEVVGSMHTIVCPVGHRSWPDPDYGAAFIAPLHEAIEATAAPQPDRVGLRRAPACPACRQRLPARSAATRIPLYVRFAVGAPVVDESPLDWTVRLPAAVCGGCGTTAVWLDREVGSELSDALIDALRRASIAS